MKNKTLAVLLAAILAVLSVQCKNGGGSGSNKPSKKAICTIDGKEISIEQFKKEYEFFIKLNYAQGRQEILREDKDEMKKYFQTQFLPKLLFIKYASKLDIFKDPKRLKDTKQLFHKMGLIRYATYLKATSKYKEPGETKLKAFYNELKQSNQKRIKTILKKIAKLPWNKKRLALLRMHKRLMTNKLTMEYLEKIRQENRLIKNDDLEQNMIKKYINGQIPEDKILSDTENKYWLIKFNDKVITAKTVEQEIRLLLFLNYGKKEYNKYLKNKKTRKNYRKLLWESSQRQWLIYLDAVKNKYGETKAGKIFIESTVRSALSQLYIMKKIADKIPEPTEKQIKQTYNKLKQRRGNLPPLNAEAKKYIKHQLKQSMGQKEMIKLFNRLKGRHVIITNDKFFQTAEEREAAASPSNS